MAEQYLSRERLRIAMEPIFTYGESTGLRPARSLGGDAEQGPPGLLLGITLGPHCPHDALNVGGRDGGDAEQHLPGLLLSGICGDCGADMNEYCCRDECQRAG